MFDNLLIVVSLTILAASLMAVYRVFSGPTIGDRVLAVDSIGTTAILILVLLSFIFDQMIFVDIALTFVMLNFVIIFVVARYLEVGRIFPW